MAGKNIDITITSKLIRSGFDAAKKAFKSLTEHAASVGKSVFTNLTNIKSGFEMMVAGATKSMQLLTKAFNFETMTVQFKTLFGNLSDAKQHMKDLQDLGDTPPFSLEEFAAASRSLIVMSQGALGFKDSLNMIGDAAAATGTDLNSMAEYVGKAFAYIRDGVNLGRALQPLVNIGAITPEVAEKLKKLQDTGASSISIWNELTSALGRYHGAMAETEKTANGLLGAIGAQKDDMLREFGAALLDVSKGGLQLLLEKMKELRSSGTITAWAEQARDAIYSVIGAISSLGDKETRGIALEAIKDVVVGGFETAATKAVNILTKAAPTIGALIAKGFTNLKDLIADELSPAAARQAAREQLGDSIYHIEKGYQPNQQGQMIPYQKKVLNDDAEEKINSLAKQIQAEMKKNKAAELRQESDNLAADYILSGEGETRLERGLKALSDLGKKFSKKAEELTKLDEGNGNSTRPNNSIEEKAKIEKSLSEQRLAEEKMLREQMEKDLHNLRMQNLKSELQTQQEQQQKKQGIQQQAQTEFEKAFAMYRSEDKGASVINEEKDYAEDYKQLQKDATRYGGKWRIDELSKLMAAGDTKGQQAALEEWRKSSSFTPEVESMVRAAAADNTQTSVEDELRQINTNTRNLAEKIEQLMQLK